MLNSISEVNTEFFKLFADKVKVADPKTGSVKSVLVRYARKSSGDYTEEQPQQVYPCISITDYTPTIHDKSTPFHNTYIGGRTEDGEMGSVFTRPIQFEFRYDVSVAAKSYFDWISIKDFIFSKYVGERRVILNSQLSGDAEVGEICPLADVRPTDVPRTDGVFETNFEFTIYVWVATKDPDVRALVKEIGINADPISG